MASLIKQNGLYYSQFYEKNRTPQRKRIPLKVKSKEVALKLSRQLENEYALGEYDPWTGFRNHEHSPCLHKHSPIHRAIHVYVEHKSEQDWRQKTRRDAEYVIKAFGRFVGEEDSIQALTPSVVNQFLNREDLAYETKRSHTKKIKPFVDWLKRKRLLQYDFSEVKVFNNDREQEEACSYLSAREIDILKAGIRQKVASDITKGYQSQHRNALWLIDFIDWQRYSGMRISETLSLTPQDIDTDKWIIRIGSKNFSTKSKKKQFLPIQGIPILRQIASKYMSLCDSPTDRLFQHKCKNRTSRTFKRYVRLYLPLREDINVHSLRHTCCIELLRRGVPIYTVQRWLRHASVTTTQKYADLLAEDISSAVGEAFS